MIALYRRLLRSVRSVNHLNRIHIALENVMTPMLASQLSPQHASSPATSLLAVQGHASASQAGGMAGMSLFESSEDWRERLIRHMALAGKAMPETFVRRRLQRDVFLFADPEATNAKQLLIVFAGGALRPMMPLHVFLQHLDAGSTDVLFLRDPTRQGFRGGLFGLGNTIGEIIDRLPTLIGLAQYGRVTVLGTSAGGIPALLAGLVLGADSVVSVGGNHPSDERWSFRGRPLTQVLPELRDGAGSRTKIFLMRGAQSIEDQPAAEATARLVGATLITVSDKGGDVRHGALFPLAQQHRLTLVLAALSSAELGELALPAPSLAITPVA